MRFCAASSTAASSHNAAGLASTGGLAFTSGPTLLHMAASTNTNTAVGAH
jgi:multisubunit Na+/H+ antiporter MnhB subunit